MGWVGGGGGERGWKRLRRCERARSLLPLALAWTLSAGPNRFINKESDGSNLRSLNKPLEKIPTSSQNP